MNSLKHSQISLRKRKSIESKDTKWEKEFEDLIHNTGYSKYVSTNQQKEIKSFISSLLARQKKELIEKIKKHKVPPPRDDYADEANNVIDDILEELEKEE